MTVDYFKNRYGYEIDGVWMPRVTAITSLVSRSFAFAPPGYATWGTLVHETVEKVLKGQETQIPVHIAPSMQAFQVWQIEHNVRIADTVDIEKQVVDWEYGFAGTLDMVAFVQGTKSVVDLKTSSAMYKEYALQTAAYLQAYNTQADTKADTRWILRIDQYQECKGCLAQKREKHGKARVKGGEMFCNHQWAPAKGEVDFQELPSFQEDLHAFFAAKEVWEWHNKEILKRITNYPQKTFQKVLV
jgi:hypothetical protein